MIGRNIARKVIRNLTHPIGLGWSLGTSAPADLKSLGIIGGNLNDTGIFANQAVSRSGFAYSAAQFSVITNLDKAWLGQAGQNIVGTDYSLNSATVPRKVNGYPKPVADGGPPDVHFFLLSKDVTFDMTSPVTYEGSVTGNNIPANVNNVSIDSTGACDAWAGGRTTYGYDATTNTARFKLTVLPNTGSPQDTYFVFNNVSADFADFKLIPTSCGLPWNTTELFTPQFKSFMSRFSGGKLRVMDVMGLAEGQHDVDYDDTRYGKLLGPNLGATRTLEAAVEMCNQLGMGLWYCVPHGASDAYITTAFTYIRDHLNKNVDFEIANENWNQGKAYQGVDVKHLINPLWSSYKPTLKVRGGMRAGTKDIASIVTVDTTFVAASGTAGTNQIIATVAPDPSIIGQPVSGTGIPTGVGSTYITNVVGTTVTLSNNLTANASGNYTFQLGRVCVVTLANGVTCPFTVGQDIAIAADDGATGLDYNIPNIKTVCAVDNSGAGGVFKFLYISSVAAGNQAIVSGTSDDVHFAELLPEYMCRQTAYFDYKAKNELVVREYSKGQISNASLAGTSLTIKWPAWLPHGKTSADIGTNIIGLGSSVTALLGKMPITAVDVPNNTLTVTTVAGTNGNQVLTNWIVWLNSASTMANIVDMDGGAKNDMALIYLARRLKQINDIVQPIFASTPAKKARAIYACQIGSQSTLSKVLNWISNTYGTSWLGGIAGAPYSAADAHVHYGDVTGGSNVITNVRNVAGIADPLAGISVGLDIKVYSGAANFTGTRQVTAFDPVAKTITFSGAAAATSRAGVQLGVYANSVGSAYALHAGLSALKSMRLIDRMAAIAKFYGLPVLNYESWFDHAQCTGVAVTYGTTGGIATISHVGNDMQVGDRVYYVKGTTNLWAYSGIVQTRDNNGYTCTTQELGTVAAGTAGTVFPTATFNSRPEARIISNALMLGAADHGVDTMCPFMVGASKYSSSAASMPFAQWVGTELMSDVYGAATYGKLQGLDDALAATLTFAEVDGFTTGRIFFDMVHPSTGDNSFGEWMTGLGTNAVDYGVYGTHYHWYWTYTTTFGGRKTQAKMGCSITCNADKSKTINPMVTAVNPTAAHNCTVEVDGVVIATIRPQNVTNTGTDVAVPITVASAGNQGFVVSGSLTVNLSKGQHSVVIRGPNGNVSSIAPVGVDVL